MEIRTLKEWREERGMSVRGLADAANVSTRTIVLVDNGSHEPTLRVWRRLAAALNIKPEQVAEFREGAELDE